MKRFCLSTLSFLVILVLSTTLAYSAAPQIPTDTPSDPSIAPASVATVKASLFDGNTDVSAINLMINLVDSEVEYRLDESTALVVVCSPFTGQPTDDRRSQPGSDFSVGLKFTF